MRRASPRQPGRPRAEPQPASAPAAMPARRGAGQVREPPARDHAQPLPLSSHALREAGGPACTALVTPLAISSPSGEGDPCAKLGPSPPDAVRSAPVERAPVQLVDRVGQARVRLVVRHHDDRPASRPAAKFAKVAEHASPTRRSSRSFVGSSARMTSWPASRARATTNRRFCPTDSSHGRWSARSASPNLSKACRRRAPRRHARPPPCARTPGSRARSAPGTDRGSGTRSRCPGGAARRGAPAVARHTSSPLNRTEPASGRNRPPMTLSRVDLPLPETPVTATTSACIDAQAQPVERAHGRFGPRTSS